MGFEIGKNVQSSDVTLKQLQEQFKKEKDKNSIVNIFNKFNTNQTANAEGEQVLDQTEQAAMMAFFKQVAGGKKDSSIDTEVSRSDVRNFKKNNKGDKFAKDLSYKDMKKMMSAFDTTINEDSADNKEIRYNTDNSGVRIIKVDGKDYKIDENNQVIDADGVKYEYKDGQLQKIQNGNTTTSFTPKGKREKDVKIENGVTTTTTYNDEGNYKKSETVADKANDTTTVTEYGQKNIPARQIVTSKGGKLETITYFMSDGKNARKTVTTDKTTEGQTVTTIDSGRTRYVKTEKTNQSDYSKEENFTLAQDGTPTRTNSTETSNGVTTKTDYKKKTRTIADTKNNTDTEITFSSFDEKSGDITVAKTVVTDKTNHSRITTNAGSKTKIIETLDNNNKTVKRTATIDTEKHTATIEVNGKKITLNTDSQGNILANAKFTGSRMETVGEAAIRLGYAKDSEEYNAIVKANGGNAKKGIKPGGHIKLPSNANTTTGLNTDNAVVDAKAEKRKWVNHQISIREANRAKYAQKAYDRYNKAHGDTLRETWATKSLQIYCEKGDDKTNGKGYVQHKIYDATSNTLVNLEKYLNLGKDEHVKRITEDGSAILTNGKTIKINIKTRKASNLSVSDYNKSFTDSTRKGAKGEISGTVDKDKHKFVYQGDYKTNVLTNEKYVRNEDGNYAQLNTTNRTNDGVYADKDIQEGKNYKQHYIDNGSGESIKLEDYIGLNTGEHIAHVRPGGTARLVDDEGNTTRTIVINYKNKAFTEFAEQSNNTTKTELTDEEKLNNVTKDNLKDFITNEINHRPAGQIYSREIKNVLDAIIKIYPEVKESDEYKTCKNEYFLHTSPRAVEAYKTICNKYLK